MDLLKYVVILALMPIWLPFLKELWGEFLLAMRSDGGLAGSDPSPMARKKLEAEIAGEELRVVHEPRDPAFRRTGTTRASKAGAGPQTGIVRRPFSPTPERRKGFRS